MSEDSNRDRRTINAVVTASILSIILGGVLIGAGEWSEIKENKQILRIAGIVFGLGGAAGLFTAAALSSNKPTS